MSKWNGQSLSAQQLLTGACHMRLQKSLNAW
jgi:hypothetical protein